MARQTFTPTDWTLYKRAQDSIAQAALTNSKRPECLVKGVFPTHVTRGEGCYLFDASGRQYIDYICGLGTNIIGYGDSELADVIARRARMGASLSLGTDLEIQTAEKLKELIPFVDQVKFLKTGTEACLAAIRIARAHTGRTGILSQGYHGWGDEFISLTPPSVGVARPLECIGTLSSEEADLDGIAAVIIEPIGTDISEARIQWLRRLRERCTQAGTLLIFDEIITGFRFPKFSVSSYYGIEPDLICLGKAIANGMPLAAVGGKRAVMSGAEYFVSSTYAGETLSLAAGLKTMELLQTKYDLQALWDAGQRFITRFNELWPGTIGIQGYPTRGVFVGDPLQKALFWQEACRAGVIFGPSFFFNFKHIEHTDAVMSLFRDIITRLKTSSVQLEGDMPSSPFAQRARGNQ